jgi:hypothetical protein
LTVFCGCWWEEAVEEEAVEEEAVEEEAIVVLGVVGRVVVC